MAIVIKPITVEVSKPNVFQAIAAKQNDSNSRFLKVTFANEGEKIYVIPSAKVTINAERKDGQSNSFFGEVNDDGTVTVPVHSWILELPGYVNCDISIIEGDSKLTSTTFTLLVEEASHTSEDISTDEQYDVLGELIKEVEGLDVVELKNQINQIAENYISGEKGTNLFDKTAVTVGFYINPANGKLVENAYYCVTDFIPVKPNETYTVSQPYNSTFFTKDKKYLTGGTSSATFIVPENAYFYRCTVANPDLNTFQMNKGNVLLPYDYYGARLTKDNFTSDLVYELKTEMDSLGTEKDLNYFDNIIKHLTNPFIKTQIKLLGDSITAGQGGTGYSATGEPIPGTSWKANVLTATSWSNMLYHYIDDYYNKDVEVSVLDEHIKYNSPSNNTFAFGRNQINIEGVSGYVNYYSYARHNGNIAIPNAVEFSFYGNHFSVRYMEQRYCGIFEVYVDDTKMAEVDSYAPTTTKRKSVDITGLSLGEHNVRIATTGRKNEASGAYQLNLEGLIIPKTAIVKPWGVSGSTSNYPIDVPSLYEEADDFVIMQFGTNDRHVFFTPDATYETLVNATNAIKTATGADVILMASCPASYEFEYGGDVVRHYHMWDVRNAIKKTAEHFRMPFIDNYDAFIKYAEEHSLEINEILFDGLHPNDLGYKVMFENIMRTLNLPIIPDYIQS